MMIINVTCIHVKLFIYVQSGFITVSDFAIKHWLIFDCVASGHSQIPIFLHYTLGDKLDLLLVNIFFSIPLDGSKQRQKLLTKISLEVQHSFL